MTEDTARPTVEFFFDFMSPTSYLAHTQLPQITDRVGAEIILRPMLTLQLHELTGNRSPTAGPEPHICMGIARRWQNTRRRR